MFIAAGITVTFSSALRYKGARLCDDANDASDDSEKAAAWDASSSVLASVSAELRSTEVEGMPGEESGSCPGV